MFEKFEKSVINLKSKIDSKTLATISFAIFGMAILFSLQMTNSVLREVERNESGNDRTMYNIIGFLKNAEVFTEKARITSTKKLRISTLVEVLNQTNLAKESLSILPLNEMNNISKFLTQTADFTTYLIKKLPNEEMSEDDFKNLETINEYYIKINKAFNKVYQEVVNDKISWKEVESVIEKEADLEGTSFLSDLQDLKNNFTEYEGLIYDGAYSSHLETTESKLIRNLSEVTLTEAKEKATQCIEGKWEKKENKKEIYSIEYKGEVNGLLELYEFEVYLKGSSNPITVQITKKGGLLYLMIQDRNVKEKNIQKEEAKQIGIKYLKSIGIESFEATYTIELENMMTINYAAVQNDVLLYPDLIKVKIALDTGEVCSVECAGYIFNHEERKDTSPALTEDQAKEVLNPKINIEAVKLAIIPTDSKKEVLTYEFKGKVENRFFLVYVNAKTAEEEEVLLILNTQGGELTM
ncbi:MAG: germination protein YpeB [Clostridia bacterium]|nr:germination protein YpeB [Clostridia bacterium]